MNSHNSHYIKGPSRPAQTADDRFNGTADWVNDQRRSRCDCARHMRTVQTEINGAPFWPFVGYKQPEFQQGRHFCLRGISRIIKSLQFEAPRPSLNAIN